MRSPMRQVQVILLALLLPLVSNSFISCSDDDDTLPTETVWNGKLPQPEDASYSFDGGSGTEADPYCISSPLQLAQLASNVNAGVSNYSGKYFLQTTNLDLGNNEWVPIGIGAGIYFAGQYDGGGFNINGLSITGWIGNNTGLFGCVQGATLKRINLAGAIKLENKEAQATVSRAVINDGYSYPYCGSVCGLAEQTVIEGCTFSGMIDNNSGYYTGGICGGMTRGTIKDCENRSNINGYNTGGIVGSLEGASEITRCRNFGNITGRTYCGGIVGEGSNSYNYEVEYSMTISRCENTGQIYSASGFATLGGIAGYLGSDNHYDVQIPFILVKECSNTASISVEFTKQLPVLGGIAGFASFIHCVACYNIGSFTCNGPINKVTVAGLVGRAGYCNTFTSCYRAGEIDEELELGAMIGSRFDESYELKYDNCWTSQYLNEDDEANLSLFSADAWPQASEYWANVGGWNNGNPVYPTLKEW